MILLIGASGYIGQAFAEVLTEKNIKFLPLSRSKLDYTQSNLFYYFLKTNIHHFDVLINCSGYVGKPNVDVCEDNKEQCIKSNIMLPERISEFCSNLMIKYVHVSSGCIYNGYDKEFTEEDEPNFTFNNDKYSFYSGSKAYAERLVNINNSYICRLRIPFDNVNNPRNYISKLINYDKLLNAKNSITNRKEFVNACLYLLDNNCSFGIYNIVNTGSVSTEQVCSLINQHLKINKDFKYFGSEEEFYSLGAKAPRSNCLLNNFKLSSTGFKIKDAAESIEESLKNWK